MSASVAQASLAPVPMHTAPVQTASIQHIPVLAAEVLAGLQVAPGSRVIDATLGGGGHTALLLAQSAPTGQLLGLDADPAAIRRVSERLPDALRMGRLCVVHAHFAQLAAVAQAQGFLEVDAILLDLGVSSFQLETGDRGFSLQTDGPLDMRMDPTQELSAAEIVNAWPEADLADVIYHYGEESRSRRIARAIVQHRPLHTTGELARVVEAALGGRRGQRIHPATQTFQALRIAVNGELEQLEQVLPQALDLLAIGGRLAVISFHSLEDRIVKRWMQQEAADFVPVAADPFGGYARTPRLRLITRKPITSGDAERVANPRSRSAKLRIAERTS